MAKRSRKQITQSLALISWLYWQILRRQLNYEAAVASCVRRWEGELHESQDPLKRSSAERALSAISMLESQCWKSDGRRADIAISMIVDEGLRHSAGLDEFVNAWTIKFPVPPSIPELPAGELLTSPWCVPVKLIKGDSERAVMDIFPFVGIEIVTAHLRGVLLHFARKRKKVLPGRAQLISRKRGAKLDLTCTKISDDVISVDIGFPVHLASLVEAVKAEVKAKLRFERTETTWRNKAYYERMLATVDAYKSGAHMKTPPKDRSVQVQIERFNSIAGLFGFTSKV